MTSVLDRDALEGSPLADLHVIANELGVDGFRRLRKADLIDAIVAKQSGEDGPAEDGATDEDAAKPRRRRSRSRRSAEDETVAAVEAADKADEEEEAEPRRGRSRNRRGASADKPAADKPADESVEGIVELQPNGSGFVRLNHPDTSDDDVYVSAAQVKRCELVTGDRVGGPVRPPRRSERFPSLVRVDTINGKSADEVAGEGTRFDDLKAAFPAERLAFEGDDETLNTVQWLTPFGKGSRVVVTGGAHAGKSTLLRRIAQGLPAGIEETRIVLCGARPEESGDWGEDVTGLWLGASSDTQAQAIEQAVELGRRVAARGGDAVVVIDSLDGVAPHVARRALAAARNLVEGGSLTVIAAAAAAPFGGETTVIALDAALTGLRRFPNVDLAASGTMRPELLVGEEGAAKIAAARAEVTVARSA